jgi:hypothetical protein
MPIYGQYPSDEALMSLQGEDSVSSNAGPAAAGMSVLGDLVAEGAGGVEDAVPADSAESTGHGNPSSPGWTKRLDSVKYFF